ncbi:MAG: DUF2235 domain-containing protein [Pseudomonadota bacterium]
MKNIVICSDGTWNKPEESLKKDHPTNVLKTARSVAAFSDAGEGQVVFYDWGLGSYHDGFSSGAFGSGINKNIQDCYRFLVHNYSLGDRIFLFGYSRGAYTVRSLAGLINSCGILKRTKANMISQAFDSYKDPDKHPNDDASVQWRKRHSVQAKLPDNTPRAERRRYTKHGDPKIHFIGVWDTVGALGVPLSLLSFMNREHMFHDNKIGPNILTARHALAIDERRDDFKPTIWKQRASVDIQQVWFAGCHGDVGGGNPPDEDGTLLSDYPLDWIADEARRHGLNLTNQFTQGLRNPKTRLNESFSGKWILAGQHKRTMQKHIGIHASVQQRYKAMASYRPPKLVSRIGRNQDWGELVT